MNAFTHVVLVRSNSRNSRTTSEDNDTSSDGNSSFAMAATRRSCAGLAYACRKHTATLVTPGVGKRAQCGARGGFVERRQHVAPMVDALDHVMAQVARHERSRRTPVDVVDVGLARRAADLEHVAEARGGEEADASFLAFHEEVRDVRACVDEAADLVHRYARLGEQRIHACEDADVEILGSARHLERREPAVAGKHQVRVRAAGVDSDGIGLVRHVVITFTSKACGAEGCGIDGRATRP
jgi:hypothetical protein